MKLFASLVVALLLCFAGATAYIWHQTNTTVDRAINAIAPYAHISYGSIISSIYPGTLGLSDVTILLEGKRLHADAITVNAASIFDLYALQQNPSLFLVKHPRLEIQGLSSPIPLRKFKLLEQPFDHPYMRALTAIDAVGCGPRREISYDDMRDMGYGAVRSDITLQSGPREFTTNWEISLQSRMQGIADYSMSISFDDAPSSLPLVLYRLERLDVNKIVLQSHDRGYNSRLLQFCAGQLGIDAETYKQRHLDELVRYFRRRSLVVEPPMLASYGEGLHRGARMRLKVQPQADFSIEDLGFYQPGDYMGLLGIRLTTNNLPAKTPSPKIATAPVTTTNSTAKPIDTAGTSPPQAKAVVETLDWSQLKRALNQDILVYTSSGGSHRGQLENVDDYLLVLKKNIGAGSIRYTIDRRRFDHARRVN